MVILSIDLAWNAVPPGTTEIIIYTVNCTATSWVINVIINIVRFGDNTPIVLSVITAGSVSVCGSCGSHSTCVVCFAVVTIS